MNRWYGKVGYVETTEVRPGIWQEQETVREYYGEFIKKSSKFRVSSDANDDRDISVELSIVADPFAHENYLNIRFVEWMGKKLVAESVEPAYPRLEITVGGEYNGEQT